MSNWKFLRLVFPQDGRVEIEVMWMLGHWVQLVLMEEARAEVRDGPYEI